MIKDQFNACPRCGKNVLKNKKICSFCGAIIKTKKETDNAVSENNGEGSKVKKYCPICGKPPTDETTCPNCGAVAICSYHVFSFFSDQSDSPRGCPRCGPKCSSCGAQTSLVHYKDRALCTTCADRYSSTGYVDKEKQRKMADTMKKVIVSLLTILGLGIGIYLGLLPDMQKILTDLVKSPAFKGPLVTATWAILGLIAGSILGSVFGSFIRT